MKVTIQFDLEGNIPLAVSADVETLYDVKKLGQKLAALPTNANKLIDGLKDRKVERVRLPKE